MLSIQNETLKNNPGQLSTRLDICFPDIIKSHIIVSLLSLKRPIGLKI